MHGDQTPDPRREGTVIDVAHIQGKYVQLHAEFIMQPLEKVQFDQGLRFQLSPHIGC